MSNIQEWKYRVRGKYLNTDWQADRDRPRHGTTTCFPIREGKETVALIVGEGWDCDRKMDARANLIIAAPSMRDAGQELLEMIEAYDLESELDAGEEGKGPVAKLRAAIAKATGKAA